MGIPIGPVEDIDSRTLDLYSRNESDEEREEVRREIREAVSGMIASGERTARNEGSLDRLKQDVLPNRKVFDAADPRTEKDDMKPLQDRDLSRNDRHTVLQTDFAEQGEAELRRDLFNVERNRNYGAMENERNIVRNKRSGEMESRRFENERIRNEFRDDKPERVEERIPERWGTERSDRPEYAPMYRPDDAILQNREERERRANAERRSEEMRDADLKRLDERVARIDPDTERDTLRNDTGAPERNGKPDRNPDRESDDMARRNSRRKDEMRSGIDIAERERLLSSGKRKNGQFRNRHSFMRIRQWKSR